MIFNKLRKFQINLHPAGNPLSLMGKLTLAALIAYLPLLFLGLIFLLIDFIALKQLSQKLIISALLGFFSSVIFHELGHILTARFVGQKPLDGIRVSARLFRVTIAHSLTSEKKWLLIIMAGPLANFLIGIFGWFFLPDIFYREIWLMFQFIFGIINLIPPSPDGEKLFAYYYKS